MLKSTCLLNAILSLIRLGPSATSISSTSTSSTSISSNSSASSTPTIRGGTSLPRQAVPRIMDESEESKKNVASHAESNHSCGNDSSRVLTDGINAPYNVIYVSTSCSSDDLFVHIKLPREAEVYEVRLWQTTCSRCGGEPFDFFYTHLLNEARRKSEIKALRSYPHPIPHASVPSIVRFPISRASYSLVRLSSAPRVRSDLVKFGITEVEVFEYDEEQRLFFGCYRNFTTAATVKGNFEDCRAKCMAENYTFFVYSLKNYCSCSNILPGGEVPISFCGKPCRRSPTTFCPHLLIERFPVFFAKAPIPEHVGCIASRGETLESSVSFQGGVTPSKCMKRCSELGKIYTLLYNGDKCFCRNAMKIDLDDIRAGCTLMCEGSGDVKEACGGNKEFSVYKGCYNEHAPGLTCHRLLKCKSGDVNEFGVCVKGCVEGWKGLRCLEFVMPAKPVIEEFFVEPRLEGAPPSKSPDPDNAIPFLIVSGPLLGLAAAYLFVKKLKKRPALEAKKSGTSIKSKKSTKSNKSKMSNKSGKSNKSSKTPDKKANSRAQKKLLEHPTAFVF